MLGLGKNKGPREPLKLEDILLMVGASLIIFQALGLIFGEAMGLPVKLGPVFVIIPILISSFMGVAILKKLLAKENVTMQDMFAVVITAIIALLVLFFLKGAVPEIFAGGLSGLQSMLMP